MNTLKIELTYEFVIKNIEANWYDIFFAINHEFLPEESAIEHALGNLEEENSPQAIIDLACLDKGTSIYPYIDELVESISEKKKKETIEKFLFLLLYWVYEKKDEYTDPLEIVEIIYADFDYPEIITNFVRYMPSSEPALANPEENTKRLYNNWNNFINDQKKIFAV